MTVFVDTTVLIALANRRDRHHGRAADVMARAAEGEYGKPVSSDYVLAEGLNYVRRKVRDPKVADHFLLPAFGARDLAPFLEIARVSSTNFAAALSEFRARWDAGLSLTDWTNIALMRERRIDAIATFDSGFAPWAKIVP